MRKPKIHNRIGCSVATLPICALLAAALWWWPQGAYSHGYAVSLLLVMFTAYIVAETNNTNMLIRTRSRMLSSVWLFGAACIASFHPFQPTVLAALCLAISHYTLFRTYQKIEPVVDIFHSFVVLSFGALVFPPMVLFAPFFIWYLLVFMRSLTFRGFFAALVGFVLPFWFWVGWLLWHQDLTPLIEWWGRLTSMVSPNHAVLDPANYNIPNLISYAPFILLALLAIWTSVYYLLNSYDDKIRTRMMLYIYVFQSALILLFSIVTSSFQQPLPLLLLCLSPLVAHYFTLRNTWVALIVFILTLLAFVALASYPFVCKTLVRQA